MLPKIDFIKETRAVQSHYSFDNTSASLTIISINPLKLYTDRQAEGQLLCLPLAYPQSGCLGVNSR